MIGKPVSPPLPDREPRLAGVGPPGSRAQRTRALLVIGLIGGCLLLLWFGDTLAGFVPRAPYHPLPVQAGAYHVQLLLDTDQPQNAHPLHATIHVSDARGQAIGDAMLTYRWTMPTMVMQDITGQAPAIPITGDYQATITPLMSGTWQLFVTVHTNRLPDATATFDIPVKP